MASRRRPNSTSVLHTVLNDRLSIMSVFNRVNVPREGQGKCTDASDLKNPPE